MNKALKQALPAIVKAARMGRLRHTGELTLEAQDVYKAALAVGYTNRITRTDLRMAMDSIGAKRAPNGHRGAKYYLPQAFSMKDALDVVAARLCRVVED